MTRRTMSAEEFDEFFDDGGDTTAYMVPGSLRQPGAIGESKRVSLTFPIWMLDALDEEADRLGVSRNALLSFWVDERLKEKNAFV